MSTKRTKGPAASNMEEWRLEAVLVSLLELSDSQGRLLCPPFRILESRQEFPQYYEKVKNPIDLRTIAENIRDRKYKNWYTFGADIKLLCKNAKTFNEPNSVIYKDACSLLAHYALKKEELCQPGKKLSSKEITHNDEIISELIYSNASEPCNFSEDSEEDEDSEHDSDPKWVLYWTIRNFDVIEGFPLCSHFLELPSKRCYADYYDEIKDPVSLYMINKNLKRGTYKDLSSLVDSFLLMFENARNYNVEGSDIFEAANKLQDLTIKTAKRLDPDIKINDNRLNSQAEENTKKLDNSSAIKKKGRKPVKRSRAASEESFDSVEVASSTAESSNIGQRQNSTKDEKYLEESDRSMSPFATKRTKSDSTSDVVKTSSSKSLPFGSVGMKQKCGRKSLEELREAFTARLLEVWNIVRELKINGRIISEQFIELPSQQRYPDYYTTISKPIDMTMIRKKIDNSKYQDSDEMVADFELLCRNAQEYNRSDSDIFSDAGIIETVVKSTMKSITGGRTIYFPYRKNDKNWSENASCSLGKSLNRPSRHKPSKSERAARELSIQQQQHQQTSSAEFAPPQAQYQQQPQYLPPPGYIIPNQPFYPQYYVPDQFGSYSQPIIIPHDQQYLNNIANGSASGTPLASHFVAAQPKAETNAPSSSNTQAITQKANLRSARSDSECSGISDLEKMRTIFDALLAYEEDDRVLSDVFYKLPSKYEYPDYYEVIRKPMDLCRIENKLNANHYESLKTFVNDLNLVFDNACKFNEPDSIIYKDALTLQKELLELRNRFDDGDLAIPSVQVQIKRILSDILHAVCAYKDSNGKCLSDWLADIHEVLRKANVDPAEFPFTLDQLKTNVEKGRYRRLDRFQDDLFSLFSKARESVKVGSAIYNVTIQLQRYYLKKRDELCKNMLLSPALLYIESQLEGDLECSEKDRRRVAISMKVENNNSTIECEDSDTRHYEEQKGVAGEKNIANNVSNNEEEELFSLLDVHRTEVLTGKSGFTASVLEDGSTAATLEQSGNTYYQQIEYMGKFYRLGDCVFVFREDKAHGEVMRIDKLWKDSEGQKFFSGGIFLRPKEIAHEPSAMFYKNEVIAVEQVDSVESFKNVQGRCAVLTVKQYETQRPTEVPECDVFVAEQRVYGHVKDSVQPTINNSCFSKYTVLIDKDHSNDGALNMRFARPLGKLKTYKLSTEVVEDEIYYFKTPLTMEKDFSPMLMSTDTSLSIDHTDLENEARHVDEHWEAAQSTSTKDANWLESQPKLNAKSKSGYILFSAEIRRRIMSENPEAGFGEVSKIVGIEWKKLTDETKRQYELRAQYIAQERAKADLLTPSSKILQPGQIRVYCCRWHACDYQFSSQEGLNKHIQLSHTDDILELEEAYVCLWHGCCKYRKDSKPFPSLPRLHRHVKEKHLPSASKAIFPNQKPKNFFVYYTHEQVQQQLQTGSIVLAGGNGSLSGKAAQNAGRFVHCPYGTQTHGSVACILATPMLSASNTTSPSSSNGAPVMVVGGGPQTPQQNGVYKSGNLYATPSTPVGTNGTTILLPMQQNGGAPGSSAVNGYSTPTGAAGTHYVIHSSSASHHSVHQSPASGHYAAVAGQPVYQQQHSSQPHLIYQSPSNGGATTSGQPQLMQATTINGTTVYVPAGSQYQTFLLNPSSGVTHPLPSQSSQSTSQPHQIVVHQAVASSAVSAQPHPQVSGTPQHVYVSGGSASTPLIQHHTPQQPHNQVYMQHQTSAYTTSSSSSLPAGTYVTTGANGTTYHIAPQLSQAYPSQVNTQVQSTVAAPAASYQLPSTSSSALNGGPAVTVQPQIDAGRTVVHATQRPSEPVFVAPPNSIQVKRVLHSEAYVKYIESIYDAKQKAVSKWDKALQSTHRNTSTNLKKLPYDWVKNGALRSNGGKINTKDDQDALKAFWRMRDQLMEATVGIRRSTTVDKL